MWNGGRRLVAWAATALIAVMAIEATAVVAYRIAAGRWLDRDSLRAERDALAETRAAVPLEDRPGSGGWPGEVVHPYLGFVDDPSPDARGEPREGIDALGLPSPAPVLQSASPERWVVGVFGGSVAKGVVAKARDALEDSLATCAPVSDREIVVVSGAVNGYKQPQQALALAYLLTLGGHFDAVVNLDGYNELVLPLVDDDQALHYPRLWRRRAARLSDTPTLMAAGRIVEIERLRIVLAGRVDASLLGSFVTPNVVWYLADRWLENRANAARAEFQRASDGDGFLNRGPTEPEESEAERVERAIALWIRGSLRMHELMSGRGALYAHFLQPNQYLEGSKPLTENERLRAYDPTTPHSRIAIRHYRRLVEAGEQLRSAGVRFGDLTRAFADRSETLYTDVCCHSNPAGYAILARRIGASLCEGLQEGAVGKPPDSR